MTLFENEPALTNHKFKIKGNKIWHLTQEYYDELKTTFPLHDVEGEMRAAKLWCKNVSACKRKTAKGMQRFLSGWVSRSEATGFVTVDAEKSPSEMIYAKNVKDRVDNWKHVISEWPVGKLKASKSFMSASRFPEFAAWALEQRPDLKGAKLDKADNPPLSEPKKPDKVDPAKVDPITDLLPPSKKEKLVELYRDAERYRDNNPEKFDNIT